MNDGRLKATHALFLAAFMEFELFNNVARFPVSPVRAHNPPPHVRFFLLCGPLGAAGEAATLTTSYRTCAGAQSTLQLEIEGRCAVPGLGHGSCLSSGERHAG